MGRQTILRKVGFFRELSHGDVNGPSLMDAVTDRPTDHESQVVAYLREGVTFILSPGPVWDVLDNQGPIGTGSVMTDGEWAWPDDLASYVTKYHLKLPAPFVQRVMANGWHVPDVPTDHLSSLVFE